MQNLFFGGERCVVMKTVSREGLQRHPFVECNGTKDIAESLTLRPDFFSGQRGTPNQNLKRFFKPFVKLGLPNLSILGFQNPMVFFGEV